VEKVLKSPTAQNILEEAIPRLQQMADFSAESLEKFARDFAVEKGVKNGQVFHPLRVAVSGRTQGPSLFHMLEIFGKDKSVARIKACLAKFY